MSEPDLPPSCEPIEKLGAGSFGEVWKARRGEDPGLVAVKILHPGRSIECLRSELEVTRGFDHPNLVVPFEWGQLPDGRGFVLSEFVPGRTLAELLDEDPTLTGLDIPAVFSQLLEALAYAHSSGVVHRDVKPGNIMVDTSGERARAVLLDFGLGVMTENAEGVGSGGFAGTLRYAAPEQIRGEAVGPAADLYAWGLVLLECLAGAAALGEDRRMGQGGSRWSSTVRVPDAVHGRGLRWVLRTLTVRDPAERELSVEEIRAVLDDPEWLPEDRRQRERRPLGLLLCRPDVSGGEEVMERFETIVESHDGLCAGMQSDALLGVFGGQFAREDDTLRAARSAFDALSASVVECAAVHLESIELEFGGDVAGLLAQVSASPGLCAARELLSQADHGQVLVGDEARSLVEEEFSVVPSGSIEGAVELHAAGARELAGSAGAFVGREAELAAIEELWEQEGGTPRLALITGEPGVGKSRLVREICDQLSEVEFLRARCSLESQGTALAPIVAMFAPVRDRLLDLIATSPASIDRAAAALAGLFDLELPDARPAQQTPEKEKAVRLQALVDAVRALAARKPVALVLEDLHWGDSQTQELLELLAASGDPGGKLLMLLTARSGYDAGWVSGRGELLVLSPLGDEEIGRLLGEDLPDDIKRQIVKQSEGIPLFASELGRFMAMGGDSEVAPGVPVSLQALVAEKMSAFGEGSRAALSVAAAAGREFSPEVVLAAARESGAEAVDFAPLVGSGLIDDHADVEGEYEFHHALIRDAVYDSIPDDYKRTIHLRLAESLGRDFTVLSVKQPEVIARHYENAGSSLEAARYWLRASEIGLRRAAYHEAEGIARRGVALLDALACEENVGSLQIELLVGLATSLFMVGGYAHPEVSDTLSRALDIAEGLGASAPPAVINGLWTYHLTRSHLEETQRMLPIFERLAKSDDPILALQGLATVGVDAWYAGDFPKAVPLLERAIELYHESEFRRWAEEYGYNGGLYAYPYAMMGRFFLGDSAGAHELRERMARAAIEAGDPYSQSICNVFTALLWLESGDGEAAIEVSDRQIALSVEQQLPLYMAGATCCKGAAGRLVGDLEGGLATLQQGLMMYQAMGIDSAYANYLPHLAATLLDLGRLDEAGAVIEEGLTGCATCHCRYHEPEFHRLRGQMLEERGELVSAEEAVQESLRISTKFENRCFVGRAREGLNRIRSRALPNTPG